MSFADLCRLADALGFRLDRVRGRHHIYVRREKPVRLNLQDRHGEAKPYQFRQSLALIEDCNLTLGKQEEKE